MLNKQKILIFIEWFLPGFKAGGPIKSISNIVNSLSKEFDFNIVTSDRDLGNKSSYKGIELDTWMKKENYNIIYLSPGKRDQWIKDIILQNNYDIYYLNSLFSKNFAVKPLLILNKVNEQLNFIIAPRGQLGKGALSIKPIKKKLFLTLAKILGFYNKVIWHATNEEEKKEIIKNIGINSKVKIASNISFCFVQEKEIKKSKNNLKLVFFSRISPKKNLLYALSLIKNIDNVELDIYGVLEDKNYWEKCNSFILSKKINANYKGEITPINVNSVLSNYHFFLFPTLHENYGHVIAEALTSGCGLIISNNTPWSYLEDNGIGWDIDLDNQEKFISVIKHCLSIDQNEYNKIRNSCYNYVKKEINMIKEIEDTRQLFK